MRKKTKQSTSIHPKTTPTFLLELPLQVNSQQAKRLRGHFEAARHLYNALYGFGSPAPHEVLLIVPVLLACLRWCS
jgi:hypothetical protein